MTTKINKSLELLSETKRKDISTEMLLNVWLDEFFNTTYDQVKDNYRKEVGSENQYLPGETQRFYSDFQVTQEQEDWWVTAVKSILYKKLRSKRIVDRGWPMTYLNCAPSVINPELL